MVRTESSPTRYRISEVARLSGFTPSALRYYEQAGVLSPTERTPSGYRLYGDRDLERLRLVARAKDLGCTLEEVGELLHAWEDDQCGPVQHRLRGLVDAKLDEVRTRLAQQATFAAQLEATAAALWERPLDGPCDDSCGCTTAEPADRAEPLPAPDQPGTTISQEPEASELAVACSLGADDIDTRLAEWQEVLRHVVERRGIPGGVRLGFGPQAPVAEIALLAAAEHGCCRVFSFAMTVDGRGIALEITAPPDGQGLLHEVFGEAFRPRSAPAQQVQGVVPQAGQPSA
jgi:MerR family transcriptional regulator, copper efflux regulator